MSSSSDCDRIRNMAQFAFRTYIPIIWLASRAFICVDSVFGLNSRAAYSCFIPVNRRFTLPGKCASLNSSMMSHTVANKHVSVRSSRALEHSVSKCLGRNTWWTMCGRSSSHKVSKPVWEKKRGKNMCINFGQNLFIIFLPNAEDSRVNKHAANAWNNTSLFIQFVETFLK